MNDAIARASVALAADVLGLLSPLAARVLRWAGDVAIEIVELERAGGSRVALAERAADRLADLVEDLKLGD